MATQTSGPFVGTPVASMQQWRDLAKLWTPDGVDANFGDTDLQVTAAADGASVNIADGKAVVQGFSYSLTAGPLNLLVSANGGGGNRHDRAVLRLDPVAGNITAVVVEGTPGGSVPTLNADPDGTWDLPLARWIKLPGGGITTMRDQRQFVLPDGRLVIGDDETPPNPRKGQWVLQLPSAHELRWSGSFWERVDESSLLKVTDLISGDSRQPFPQDGHPSGTFIAPLSGQVWITVSAELSAGAGRQAFFSARVSGPGGYSYVPAANSADVVSVGYPSSSSNMQLSAERTFSVDGLTPGSQYTVIGVHGTTGGSCTFDNRRIIVRRA